MYIFPICPMQFGVHFPTLPAWSDVPSPAKRTAPAQVVDAALHDQRNTVVGIPQITMKIPHVHNVPNQK